jgi:crotonobetainyl-CoA:carnitine CoA-transferase CaiB-like acyl-CoA transferase
MPNNDSQTRDDLPLSGCCVVECSRTVAAAYAGRLLAVMGATVVMLEPPGGSPLRQAPPWRDEGHSALFDYLAVGKRSVICDTATAEGQRTLERELERADILVEDTPVSQRETHGLTPGVLTERFPDLVHVSVLPFGASGPKANWDGEEINLIHASGEGFLLPNGRSYELYPERPPLKIYGHFASYQGGCVAAFSALSAWWAAPYAGGQYIDVSVQDAMLLCGAFALQRLGDGSLEHRSTRSFRYGGVFEARDGFIELLTLEDRQWLGLVQLLGNPAWALDPTFQDPLERSRRGGEINEYIREWVARHDVENIVNNAQQLGVPAAKYRTPAEVVEGEQERTRSLFAPCTLQKNYKARVLVAPFVFHRTPLQLGDVPSLEAADKASVAKEELS